MALFEGLATHHGTHGAPEPDGRGKMGIKKSARTLREPVTLDLWQRHLAGDPPLGIVTIREDSTCKWGSIDYDKYGEDLVAICSRVAELGLPLVPCRSKSGGLHLFLFATTAIPADDMRVALSSLAAQMGMVGSEIFPKQSRVIAERGDVGNWMIMPYFGQTYEGTIQKQVGLRSDGTEMDVEEFVDVAWEARQTPEQVAALRASGRRRPNRGNGAAAGGGGEVGDFSDGPPCLQRMAEEGVTDLRNEAMFGFGVYLKKKHPEAWKDELDAVNHRVAHPPLPPEEILQLRKSIGKKDYRYKCKTEPMCSHCDSALCRARPFGVGEGVDLQIELTVIRGDPQLYVVRVGDREMTLKTAEIAGYRAFSNRYFELTDEFPPPMREDDWKSHLSAITKAAPKIEASPDSTDEAHLGEILTEFCTNRKRGERAEDILVGRPWFDDEGQRYVFRMRDLVRHLDRERCEPFRQESRNEIGKRLRKLDADNDSLWIKGKSYRVWRVPAAKVDPAEQDLPTPSLPKEPL